MNENNYIDVVISWVDGNEHSHKQKMLRYLNKKNILSDDIAGPTRFRSEGEIFYCVASIYRFAPFVRKIFIITDNQNPNLESFISKNFPESKIELEIVDHLSVFKSFEQYLPVFNSLSIETCTFRIPGLSENYVYFNDDFFLVRPVKPTDWFLDNKIIAYGNWRNMLIDRFIWLLKPLKNGNKPIGYKDMQIAASRRLGYFWKYFYIEHLPHPIKKSVIEDFYDENVSLIFENIKHRFRNKQQFNPQSISYMLLLQQNKAIVKSAKDVFLFVKPVKRGNKYVERKINAYDINKNILFCCIESIDLAENEDRERLFGWLKEILNIHF